MDCNRYLCFGNGELLLRVDPLVVVVELRSAQWRLLVLVLAL